MSALTVALSAGALVLDRGIDKRKFRVIASLDALMSATLEVVVSPARGGRSPVDSLRTILHVAADDPDQPVAKGHGASVAPAVTIYVGTPLIFSVLSLVALPVLG
jgi:hypothetical protein